MDEALYTAYMTGTLRLSEHGTWYHEGEPFSNAKLRDLFHRSVTWDPKEEQYYVAIGKGRATFTCEDTAYFVCGLDTESDPWRITLLDGTTETLQSDSLNFGKHDQLYCTVKGGHRARFMRNVHQQLLEHVIDDSTVLINGLKVSIPSA